MSKTKFKIEATTRSELDLMSNADKEQLESDWQAVVEDCNRWEGKHLWTPAMQPYYTPPDKNRDIIERQIKKRKHELALNRLMRGEYPNLYGEGKPQLDSCAEVEREAAERQHKKEEDLKQRVKERKQRKRAKIKQDLWQLLKLVLIVCIPVGFGLLCLALNFFFGGGLGNIIFWFVTVETICILIIRAGLNSV